MSYLILALVCLAAGGYAGYKYGSRVVADAKSVAATAEKL